ncbi:BTAD domain-containing putative transcriptional regulator [Nordella sp. HKS 07]|uniref:BTAD domain-containing putative transcriptional regulator n=1 Tax=Nordella sp. HKS 07 TaxID=2712222 RepID=UPI00352CB6C1
MTATREKVADLLWSDSDSEHSRNSLRQTLSVLRQDLSSLGAAILHSNKDTIGLSAIDTDAAILEMSPSVRSGSQLEEATSVYTGPFLDGFFAGSSTFEDWAAVEREKLLVIAIGSLEKLARLVDVEKGLAIALRLLALDPTREASYRLKMELLALSGQRDRAVRTFESCRVMLQKEFGVDVSPETRRLWQSLLVGPDPQLLSSAPMQMSSAADAASWKKPSVGVLGFVNLTAERGETYFAKGLVQDIATALSQQRDYAIVTELPTFTTETGSLDVRRIATTYNVQYLLNGSVQRVADDLRVNVQLIDTANGQNVWAERFDGRVQEGLEFQDRIAQSVMVALGIELQLTSWKVRDKSPPGSPEVRRLINQALTKYYEMTKASLQAAMRLAEQALTIDPDNPRAMRTLSIAISVGPAFGALPNMREHTDRAISLAESAAKAVPDDEIARCFLAYALSSTGRIEEAVVELRHAIALNPNYAHAHGDLAILYALQGQTEDALHQTNESIRLGPLGSTEFWRHHSIVVAKFGNGDDREALEAARKVVRTRQGFIPGALYWAAAAMATGNDEEASRAVHHCLSQIPELSLANVSPGYVPRYASDKNHQKFLTMLSRAGLPES